MNDLDDLISAVELLQNSVTNLTESINIRKSNLDSAIQSVEDIKDDVILIEQNVQGTSDFIIELSKEKQFDSVNNFLYCGVAPYQSNITDLVWTISRIEVFIDGTTTVSVANNVAWTDRLTTEYN